MILSSKDDIPCLWLGMQRYDEIWALQRFLHNHVHEGKIKGVVLYLEHHSVYTLGKNADQNNLLDLQLVDSNVVQTDRGGDVTYHGPGQLIVYPILDLNQFKKSISWYVDVLEQSIIEYLKQINIEATTIKGLTGVWVNDKKICALGIRISKWITMHGFALNFNTDINSYEKIIPCGINHFGITSIEEENGLSLSIEEQIELLNKYIFENLYKRVSCEV